MNAVNTKDLRAILRDVKPAVPQPTWDFLVYCRFLAERMPEAGVLAAGEFAAMAEDLISELRMGIDKRNGATFEPPLVSGRSDLVYNYFRTKLNAVAEKVGGSEYAAAFGAGLKPVVPPAKPAPAAAGAAPPA